MVDWKTIDVKAFKPKMKSINSIDDLPLPSTVSAKADGEFNVVYYVLDESTEPPTPVSASLNRYERVRYNFNLEALSELEHACSHLGIKSAIFLGELHAVRDGKPLDLPNFNRQKKSRGLRLGLFELVMIDGEKISSYRYRLEKMEEMFRGCNYLRVLPFTYISTYKEAKLVWDRWVTEQGYEGIIARKNNGDIYKLRPIHSIDAVIIGVNKKPKLKENLVTSLKLAVLNEQGHFIDLTDVASGITHKMRTELLNLLDKEVGEDTQTIYIEPEKVVEIQYQQTYDADKVVRRYQLNKFVRARIIRYYSLRHPRFIRFRTDKDVDHSDIGMEQIPTG